MRFAIIYRPGGTPPPPDLLPTLLQGMGQWMQRYGERIEALNFFVGGGGLGIIDTDDVAELQRLISEHPFTIFADVEIRPLVDAQTALAILQETYSG